MTKRKYRPPTQEELNAYWRQRQKPYAIRKAHHNNTAPLVALLREDGEDELADLIKRGRWSKRGAPPLLDSATHIKRQAVALPGTRR